MSKRAGLIIADYISISDYISKNKKLEICFELEDITGRNCLTVWCADIMLTPTTIILYSNIEIKFEWIYKIEDSFYENGK